MSSSPSFPSTFEGLLQLGGHLRGPDGCPWDRKQTRESMRRYILEECYELLQAIDEADTDELVEELGDVVFHVAFQVLLGREHGAFTEEDVFRAVIDKLVSRHPHVFGDATASDAEEVLASWQSLKRSEHKDANSSILDGAPEAMPGTLLCPGAPRARGGRGLRLGGRAGRPTEGRRGAGRAGGSAVP